MRGRSTIALVFLRRTDVSTVLASRPDPRSAEGHGRSPFIAMLDRPCDMAFRRIDRRLFYCPTHLIERRFMPAIRLIEKSLPIDD
jgi:hypothetical protein